VQSNATERPAVSAVRPSSPSRGATLSRLASLNALQSLLDYTAKLLVGLVVVPILVSGLGRSLFGVWEMLSRLVGYLAATDGRATQALRLLVANQQGSLDTAAKRRCVGGALLVWLLCLPLGLAIGGLFVWLSPTITKVPRELEGTVRLACTLLVAGLLLAGLGSIPESVLRGMNLGYRRMGLQSALSLVGGALTAWAVYTGLGLVGVAAAQIGTIALTAVVFWCIVRRYVPWFGVARPHVPEARALIGMSLWLAAGDLVAKLLTASDVLVLGMVVSASAVTTYVLTGYSARLAVNLHALTALAATPGLGRVIGQRTFKRAAMLRGEMLVLTGVFVTAAGSTILLWNRSFLELWVGAQHYAGPWINLLIVLIASQTGFIRVDAYVLDSALQPRLRVLVSGAAAALTLLLTVALTDTLGMLGLCLGVLAGRLPQSIAYPVLVRSCLDHSSPVLPPAMPRLLVTMLLFFGGAGVLGERVLADTWIEWTIGVGVSGPILLAAAIRLGLTSEARQVVMRRLRALALALGPRGDQS
jgi:O-antigen/teichoic acid export membrane protein